MPTPCVCAPQIASKIRPAIEAFTLKSPCILEIPSKAPRHVDTGHSHAEASADAAYRTPRQRQLRAAFSLGQPVDVPARPGAPAWLSPHGRCDRTPAPDRDPDLTPHTHRSTRTTRSRTPSTGAPSSCWASESDMGGRASGQVAGTQDWRRDGGPRPGRTHLRATHVPPWYLSVSLLHVCTVLNVRKFDQLYQRARRAGRDRECGVFALVEWQLHECAAAARRPPRPARGARRAGTMTCGRRAQRQHAARKKIGLAHWDPRRRNGVDPGESGGRYASTGVVSRWLLPALEPQRFARLAEPVPLRHLLPVW